ncbi:class I SAM-dependent methyltransferase [Haloarcula pellucida]|uniref:Class I SAM-dependent methyltransferase n=1 Tax=Haloarcula pellucida TaxID=1427151 RepID=A0A830GKV2_9EURY|nr:class I SAM-dependent methyltransferase [Halomicroarcula pellucida]MBX0348670.1 class I SAM-dependent methyltransferase [Halomicroarcula pellucida]GGN92294.1 hypothetical protein GCM10009030_16400 [Halomicroarcula pellucida]
MISKANTALDILREDGPSRVCKESASKLLGGSHFGRDLLHTATKYEIKHRIRQETGVDTVLDSVIDSRLGFKPYQIHAAQLRDEFRALALTIMEANPDVVMEIGTAAGGSLYTWTNCLNASLYISLDLPEGSFGGGHGANRAELYQTFAEDGDMALIHRDSHDPATVDAIKKELDGKLLDFLFIDGDHSYDGVKQDFRMYRNFVSEGGIIAFHDIVCHPDDESVVNKRRKKVDGLSEHHLRWSPEHQYCQVNEFWEEVSEEYESEEFISHPKQTWGGIGVLYL